MNKRETLLAWTNWANSRSTNVPIPNPAPPPHFIGTLRTSPGRFHSEGTLLRLSAAAETAAKDSQLSAEDQQLWLQAVITAHANWNAEHSQGAYGWADTAASDAMTALLPKAFPARRD